MSTHYESLQASPLNQLPPEGGEGILDRRDPDHEDHFGWVDENDPSKGKDPDKPLGPDGKPIKIIN